MAESASRPSPTRSDSNESYDFIETCDLPPPILPPVTSETNSASISETFSNDSQEQGEIFQAQSNEPIKSTSNSDAESNPSENEETLSLLENGNHVATAHNGENEILPVPPPAQVPVSLHVKEHELKLEELGQEFQRTPPVVARKVHVIDDIHTLPSPCSKLEGQENIANSNQEDSGNNNHDNEDKEYEVSKERKIGAGITIGIIAAPICGPVLAVVAGVAAAYGTSKPGVTGDTCRAAGDIAMVAKEKMMEVDKKHDVMSKTKEGANQMIDKAKEANEKHRILENLKKIIGCTLKNVGDALQFAADKMKETRENHKQKGRDRSASTGSDYSSCSYEKFSAVVVDEK